MKLLIHYIKAIFRRLTITNVERIISSHWFNPFATVYFNFRILPLHQAYLLPIWLFGNPKLYDLSGSITINGNIRSGMITINRSNPEAPSFQNLNSEITIQGKLLLNGGGIIGCGTRICIATRGVLSIGGNFKITDMCNVGCYKNIKIGNNTRITQRCQIFDTSYHYVANLDNGTVPNHMKAISIGNDCWICNSSTITGGTMLPDKTIVASNSLCNKSYTNIRPMSLIGGTPAKLIASNLRRFDDVNLVIKVNRHYRSVDDVYHISPEEKDLIES